MSLHFFRVELEEVGDAIGVGAGRRKAVCLVNERVEVRVGWRGRREPFALPRKWSVKCKV